MELTSNQQVLGFVGETAALTRPQEIIWIDGSQEQLAQLRQQALESGELLQLNPEKLPGCYYHRSQLNDVARVEGRTYICARRQEDAGPTNNWMEPQQAYAMARGIMAGSMEGRTLYVIPFSMGPVGSPFAKAGIQLTDSIYVVLSMAIMTRVGRQVLEVLGQGNDFVRGLHAKCQVEEEQRYILHFPEDNAIWSCNSAYGGNALLGKKCFALRIASYQGKTQGWLAEHMLILGVEDPQGNTKYIAAAFPSACGKTNLAMLIPPEIYQKRGYKVWCVGDDIAWIRVGEDGRLWAINPEAGFFGVAPGTSQKSNPNALATTHQGTIFTNVALNPQDNTVWWEGLDKNPPAGLVDWQGNPWSPESGTKAAHPNSRFTAPAKNCPCISSQWESAQGVPLSAIVFGGRRAKTAPLVYQARDWDHGVFVGSIMASETTAAAAGQVGVVRRDPMAMLPFCGYHMGDYFAHWLDMGKKATNPPKIFNVNWFRLSDSGKFLWPGFGDNFRVLEWILRRCEGELEACESEIGLLPHPQDIDLTDLHYQVEEGRAFDAQTLGEILQVEREHWLEDCKSIEEFYNKLGDKVPQALRQCLSKLEQALGYQAHVAD